MKRPTDLATMSHTIAEAAEGLDQRILARWAADCAERVLDRFEALHPHDERPRDAIRGAATGQWRDRRGCGPSSRLAAHGRLARLTMQRSRCARAARPRCRHRPRSWDAIHAAAYAAKAMDAAACADGGQAAARERTWQLQQLRAASADARQRGQ